MTTSDLLFDSRGGFSAEKNSAQTNRQTDTTKIMVTWSWTKTNGQI